MRLPWATTYASCQGTEYPGTLAIHDTDNPHFSRRHLFVALSRAKEASNVCVR
jgi:ATP-dependent exoDNAse (exonuclease V) alpha subunit